MKGVEAKETKKPSTKDKKHHEHHVPSYMKEDISVSVSDDFKKK